MEGFDRQLDLAKSKLGVSFQLRDSQIHTLKHLYNGHDCVCVLPTGYGKSLIFQMLPFFIPGFHDDGIVIVVSPLTSLMQDQVLSLVEKNVKACFLTVKDGYEHHGTTYSLGNDSDEDTAPFDGPDVCLPLSVTMSDLRKGSFNIIYAHPEALLNSSEIGSLIRSKLYAKRVCAIVIDEVHMITEWGEEFRPAFRRLSELVCLFPRPALHIALTATATPASVSKLIKELQLTDVEVVTVNPDRTNIYMEIRTRLPNVKKYDKYDDLMKPIATELKGELADFPVTIVYVNQLDALGYCYQYLDNFMGELAYFPIDKKIPENRLFAQYHKDYTNRMKNHIVSELRKDVPKVRLVLATVALGMGLNAPSVNRVIHFQPPTTLEKYAQEVGRAGRSGQKAVSIMYYNKSDIATNRPGISSAMINYCLSTTCLRLNLINYFGFQTIAFKGAKEDCCCNCRMQC